MKEENRVRQLEKEADKKRRQAFQKERMRLEGMKQSLLVNQSEQKKILQIQRQQDLLRAQQIEEEKFILKKQIQEREKAQMRDKEQEERRATLDTMQRQNQQLKSELEQEREKQLLQQSELSNEHKQFVKEQRKVENELNEQYEEIEINKRILSEQKKEHKLMIEVEERRRTELEDLTTQERERLDELRNLSSEEKKRLEDIRELIRKEKLNQVVKKERKKMGFKQAVQLTIKEQQVIHALHENQEDHDRKRELMEVALGEKLKQDEVRKEKLERVVKNEMMRLLNDPEIFEEKNELVKLAEREKDRQDIIRTGKMMDLVLSEKDRVASVYYKDLKDLVIDEESNQESERQKEPQVQEDQEQIGDSNLRVSKSQILTVEQRMGVIKELEEKLNNLIIVLSHTDEKKQIYQTYQNISQQIAKSIADQKRYMKDPKKTVRSESQRLVQKNIRDEVDINQRYMQEIAGEEMNQFTKKQNNEVVRIDDQLEVRTVKAKDKNGQVFTIKQVKQNGKWVDLEKDNELRESQGDWIGNSDPRVKIKKAQTLNIRQKEIVGVDGESYVIEEIRNSHGLWVPRNYQDDPKSFIKSQTMPPKKPSVSSIYSDLMERGSSKRIKLSEI